MLLTLGAGSAHAAGNGPEWAMNGGAGVADRELPPQAVRGSGVASTLNPAAFGASGLYFPLADGRVLHAQRQRIADDPGKGRKSWIGTFEDEPGSFVILTLARGVTTGFITHGAGTFEIVPARGGKHLIYEVDASRLPQVEPVLLDGDTAADTGGTTDYGTGGAVADGGHVHDLLVVYTPASAARHGAATLESKIVAAVNAANQAYLNSGVNITLNLVGLQQVSYAEPAGISEALYDLRGTTDGRMDTVHALRDSLGADLVSLISENSDACGIGFLMRSESSSFASSAFNVVYSSCLSQHSLAHELGHNQGNMHDRASSSYAGTFEYSYGHRRCATDGSGFRTVMSYSCSGASRVTQFSNPAVNYNGYPTGVSYESDPANSAENVRSMNLTADTVAAFRGGTSGGSSGGTQPAAPAAPSSLKASASSADAITVSWSDNSTDESGFKLERSSNGVDFSEVASLGANAASFADTGLPAKASYWYRVRAFNSAGLSGYSNTGSATTPDVAPAAPLSVSAADNGDGSAGVSWVDASANETGFEVRRETWDSRRGTWKGTTTVGTVPAGVTSLVDMAGNGTYRYSVRAISAGAASSFAGPAEVSVTGGSSKKGGGGGGKGRTKG